MKIENIRISGDVSFEEDGVEYYMAVYTVVIDGIMKTLFRRDNELAELIFSLVQPIENCLEKVLEPTSTQIIAEIDKYYNA